jgi:hypothetical protein
MPRSITKLNRWKAKIHDYIAQQPQSPEPLSVLQFLLEDFVKTAESAKPSSAFFETNASDPVGLAKYLLSLMKNVESFDLMKDLDLALGSSKLKDDNELQYP